MLYLDEYDFQETLIDAFPSRLVPPQWAPVTVQGRTYFVTADALQLDGGEGLGVFRPSVTARSQQAILDALGWSSVPVDVALAILQQTTAKIEPQTRGTEGMASKTAMLAHSADVDQALAGIHAPPGALVGNAGKFWLGQAHLTSKPVNFGWSSEAAPYTYGGVKMWQTPGQAHNFDHVDYSQTIRALWPYYWEGGDWHEFEPYPCAPREKPTASQRPPISQEPVVLKRGSQGAEVRRWQEWLTANYAAVWIDGDFGPQTEGATRGAQRAMGIEPTGEVTEYTWAAARLWVEERSKGAQLGELDIPYLEAKNYTRRERFAVDWIVIHSAETAETPTVAEALQSWCAGPHAPQASWHYAVDNNSITQSVKDNFIAWHAPGANDRGIGIELGGRASQTREQWLDAYGQAMLDNAARLLAYLSQKWNIPLDYVDVEGLKAGKRGVTTHRAVTYAWRRSTHIDPGAHFPMDVLLDRASKFGQ